MGAHCCNHDTGPVHNDGRYRRILWIALLVNLVMFVVEIGAGLKAGSVSLLADSLDFLGDAANYAISLWVLGMALTWRARAAQFKALSMLLFGLAVLGAALWHWWQGAVPSAPTMGVVGTLALLANLGVAVLLYAYREGDSNMRSVWLCTRNDALGNLAVLAAALGVFGTGSAWPDLIVASIMASLAITAAIQVLRQADGELKGDHGHAH
ncbi:cation diffusion facilitator family transporter [Pseudomonas sp. GOM6]|uniref:cation transporter n=1 Tax=Pseudomonas sp. GOM6 TaxID=3036944 RepID=UPI00240904FF|nr:cation diffusion facilitator family transporter [Pseudomonas sp. GOM6]MDG1582125.1 cation diffusion facilitator family transporter [Pseudomonas sp. GOM6]